MNNIKLFEEFLFENKEILDKFRTYSFDNKISQSNSAVKSNALNIKEVIHTACNWTGDKSCYIFLFEIAIVETSLGCSRRSKATKGDIGRGVWHVDEGTFNDTKTSPKMEKYRNNLLKYGLDWTKVEWNDLSLNLLLGAIGAKMTLLMKGVNSAFSPNLNSLEKRADYYTKKYNCGGTTEAEENYINNCKAWYSFLLKQGAEYLEFNGKKYLLTKNGLALNDQLV
jgi:hypothetical protein